MIITYQRPTTLEAHQVDQDAPDADLSPTGATCGTTTVDVLGIQWSCSRAPHPGQDEHRATIPDAGDGPTGGVAKLPTAKPSASPISKSPGSTKPSPTDPDDGTIDTLIESLAQFPTVVSMLSNW